MGRGHPSVSLLATSQVAAASAAVFSRLHNGDIEYDDDNRHPLQYGTDPGPLEVRKTICSWLARKYNTKNNDADLLAITCGASFGLANTCLQMTDPQYTRRIFMITPAYFLAARMFQDAGYEKKMYAIDEHDADGPDIEQLEAILRTDAQDVTTFSTRSLMNGKRYKYLFYGVPSFSNPSGIVWSQQKRQKLLDLARKYDILLITDEVYDFLDYRTNVEQPLPRIVDLDYQEGTTEWGNTISNMSFSKYLGPGLRIGTVQGATKKLVDQWSSGGANHSGGMMAQHTSYYIAEMIANGSMESVLSKLQSVYRERSRYMLDALQAQMPPGSQVYGGNGGYFIWVKLPETLTTRISASDLLALAREEEQGVHALSGGAFEVPGHERGWHRSFFRLSLSYIDKEDALDGIRILGQVIQRYQR